MTTRRTVIKSLGAAALTVAAPQWAGQARVRQESDEWMVGVPNNLFANIYDGKPTGIVIEAIDLVLRRMKKRPVYVVMPPGDIAAGLADGTVAVQAVTVVTPRGRDYAYFSDEVVTEYNVIAVRAAQDLHVRSISDLYGLKLGGRQGYQYPMMENDPRITLQLFPQDAALIRNLILGQIDAAVISAISDIYKLRAEGVMPRIRILERAVGAVPLCVGLSRRICSESDLGRFNEELAALKAGPVWGAILERNGISDLAVPWKLVE